MPVCALSNSTLWALRGNIIKDGADDNGHTGRERQQQPCSRPRRVPFADNNFDDDEYYYD
jgi:hypothetical protein